MSYQKIFFAIISFVFLFSVAVPVFAINIWEGTTCAPDPSQGPTASCSLCDGLIVAQNIIRLLWELAIPIAVAMIIFGAFQMMFSAGSATLFATGKKTIFRAIEGLCWALAAWLIINTVLHLLAGHLNLPWNQISCFN